MLLLLSLSWWTRPFGTTVLALQCSSSRLPGMTINGTFSPPVASIVDVSRRVPVRHLEARRNGWYTRRGRKNTTPTPHPPAPTHMHTHKVPVPSPPINKQGNNTTLPPVLGYLGGDHNQMSHFLAHRLSDTPYSLQPRDPVISKSSGLLVIFTSPLPHPQPGP